MSDLISRQALCEYAFNQKDKCVTPNDIMRFPSAQPVNYGSTKSDSSSQLKLNNDLISRQAVIDTVSKWFYDVFGITESDGTATIFKRLRELPSAQSERKTGKWVWWYEESFTEHATEYTPHCKCSECGRECAPSVATYSNFCRNCGADMRGDSE